MRFKIVLSSLFVWFAFNYAASQSAKKDSLCFYDAGKLKGNWHRFYFQSHAMEMDSIYSYLSKYERQPLAYGKFANAGSLLSFNSDSAFSSHYQSGFYYIDRQTCSLVFKSQPKAAGRTVQKIYVLTEKFLVLRDCSLDCFTEFYVKE